MRSSILSALAAVALVVVACTPNPADCYEKGDEKACQKLCDTGKQELMSACYEVRARGALACADGKGDCTAACQNWKNAQAMGDDIKNLYVAKLGPKVVALNAKCGAK